MFKYMHYGQMFSLLEYHGLFARVRKKFCLVFGASRVTSLITIISTVGVKRIVLIVNHLKS